MAQDKPEIKLVEHCVTIIICLLGKKARKRGGDFGDVFRVNAKVLTREYFECRIQVIFSVWRWNAKGWLGYNLNEKDQSIWFNSVPLVFNNTTLTTGFQSGLLCRTGRRP
jgi:hypothetical protein